MAATTQELSGRELLSHLKNRGIKVEKGTPEYEALRKELRKAGEYIEAYGCRANIEFYEDAIELLPDEDKEKYRKLLEMHMA